MIKTYKELLDVIKKEKKLYFGNNRRKYLEKLLVRDKDIYIFKFQKYLRKSEYCYNNKSSIIHSILYLFYRMKKNRLGVKLGIEIWENTFESGLRIWHAGSIVVNGECKVGENCQLKGNNCIGNNGKNNNAPKIGDNVSIGNGAIIIGPIEIADETVIAAGAVVTKSFHEKGCVLKGVPAEKMGGKN